MDRILNIRSSVGMYNQFPSTDWSVLFSDTLDQRIISSQHVALGVDGAIAQRWELGVMGGEETHKYSSVKKQW